MTQPGGSEKAREDSAADWVESLDKVPIHDCVRGALYHAYCAGWIAGAAHERDGAGTPDREDEAYDAARDHGSLTIGERQ